MVDFTPEKCKQIALARLDIVHKWLEFRKQSQNKLQADYDFVKLHITSNSHIFEILGKISRGSLHRWLAMLNGTEDYTKLLPKYRYSSVNDYRTVLNDDEIKIFMGLLLHPNRLSIGKAIALTKAELTIEDAVQYFITNYAAKFCSKKTNRIYKAAFKLDILPILKKNKISEFNKDTIITIYNTLLERDFKPRRLKNTMALIKQFLKYCKAEGIIKNYTNFYVKRLTEKNEYSLDRIIFEV